VTELPDEYRPNLSIQTRRQVRVTIELPAGQVSLELEEPTSEQVQMMTDLVSKWVSSR
jgi:hypothetical protein